MEDTYKKQIEESHKEDGYKCRNCIHRERFELNEHSAKIIQCCTLQRSRKSNSGYVTIKTNKPACYRFFLIPKIQKNLINKTQNNEANSKRAF